MKNYFKNIKDKKFIISIICMLGIQMVLYILTKRIEMNYHTLNYNIDKRIPFIPQMVIIYNLFYPIVFLVFYNIFNHDKDTYYKGIISGILGYIVAYIIFFIYPTIIVRPDISNLNIDTIHSYVMYLTYKYDAPAINCLPSIHCLFCFQTIYSLIMCKNCSNKYKIPLVIVLLLIIASTVFVKQHYFVDVIAALIVCIITNLVSPLIYKKTKHQLFS